MKRQAALLVALIGALLVAGSAAGPIRPVAEAKPESDYVFVKLLFDGHDQPNFDRWHSNATAATVAQVAGVPLNYLIRLVDGKIPGTKEAAPAAKQPAAAAPAQKPAAPVAVPEPAPAAVAAPAPVAAAPAPAAAAPAPVAAAPAPATAAPVAVAPAATPAPAAATPAPAAAPTVTLITSPTTAAPKLAEPEQKAVQTKPESGEASLPTPVVAAPEPQRPSSLWDTVSQALAATRGSSQQQQQQQDQEPPQQPATDAPRNRPRVFVIGGRRLMGADQVAPNQAVIEWAIKTNASEPWAVRETVKRKLMASAAGFGMAQGTSLRGFYTLLREHGVGYYPAMWVDGEQILSGQVGMEAPPNRFVNGTSNKNFQHKLYKHTDLVKPKAPTANTTNVTIVEPAFIMANRSTSTETTTTSSAAPHKHGLAPWVSALIALGTIAVVTALAATVWRIVRDRRARKAEEDAAHSEPLSPHSVASHSGM